MIGRRVEYLRKDSTRPLVLDANNDGLLMWYVDASFAVHPNMRGAYRRRSDSWQRLSHYSIY